MSASNLTAKQEAFAQAIVSGMNASNAYRHAYKTEKMKDATINREAKALTDNHKIAARIAALRAPAVEKAQYGYEQAMKEADAAYEMAQRVENPSAMVAAAQLRAKLSGLMVEDRKNNRNPFDGMTTDELRALLAKIEPGATFN